MASRRLLSLFSLGLASLLLASVFPVHAVPADTTALEVRLYHQSDLEAATITAHDGPLRLDLPRGGASPLRVDPGDSVQVRLRQNEVHIQGSSTELYGSSLKFTPVENGARWSLNPEKQPKRKYTGPLRLGTAPEEAQSLLFVNQVPLQDYVAGVVATEYGFEDEAGTNAMAVVARTYALYAAKHDRSYDHTDGQISQVYNGVDPITPQSRQAARETQGEVLTANRRPIQAVYSASSGGHTADNEDVWDADKALPYLRGRPDPYDKESPYHQWEARLDRPTVLQALSRAQDASVGGFVIEEETDQGRVKGVKLLQSDGSEPVMNANDFRLLVNRHLQGTPLKSTWFDAQRQGDRYVFEGRGFGHGVGLSQWGAHAMAQEGTSYREILRYYYDGVQITSLENISIDSQGEAIARSPSVPEPDSSSSRIGW